MIPRPCQSSESRAIKIFFVFQLQPTKETVLKQTNNLKMENPNEITILDVLELAHSLRQEQLSIANERNSYIKLNESLQENSANASQVSDFV